MDSLLPFLQGFCLPCNMAVYPGAQWVVANSVSGNKLYLDSPELVSLELARAVAKEVLILTKNSMTFELY